MVELAVFGTAKAQIRHGAIRIGPHARSKALQRGGIEGLFIGLTDEVFRGDQEALTVKGHLKGGAKSASGMAFALLDGAGIEVIEGDQAVVDLALAGQFLLGLLIQKR